ncbi:MAG: hypothetical protein HN348_25130 [Proteobacteria bacterium]|nr:hypothetical protein [Pseudomonadota bacterium]
MDTNTRRAAEERHYRYCAKCCRHWVDAVHGPDEMHWNVVIRDEYHNLLAAFRRAIDRDPEEATDIFRMLDVVFTHRGPRDLRQSMIHQLETRIDRLSPTAQFQVALSIAASGEREQLDKAMSLATSDLQRLRVMAVEAWHLLRRGDALHVVGLETKIRELAAESGDPILEVEVLTDIAAAVLLTEGHAKGAPLLEECMARAERHRLPRHRDDLWTALSWIDEYSDKRLDLAEFGDVLERTRLRGFRLEEAKLLRGYSKALRRQQRFKEAIQALTDARICCREVGAHRLDALVCLSLGRSIVDPVEAEKYLQLSLSWFEDNSDKRSAALVCGVLGMLRLRQPDQSNDAMSRFRIAADGFDACGDEFASAELEMEFAVMTHLGGEPGNAVEQLGALSKTRNLPVDLRQRLGCRLGAAAAAVGDLALARRCLEGGHPMGEKLEQLYRTLLFLAKENTVQARQRLLHVLTPDADREGRPPFLDNDEMLIATRLLHWSLTQHGVSIDESLVPWV